MSPLPDAAHPVWGIIKTLILVGGLLGILWLNASQFDHTELRVWAEMILIALGLKGGEVVVARKKGE